jgi:hypothetical protein
VAWHQNGVERFAKFCNREAVLLVFRFDRQPAAALFLKAGVGVQQDGKIVILALQAFFREAGAVVSPPIHAPIVNFLFPKINSFSETPSAFG